MRCLESVFYKEFPYLSVLLIEYLLCKDGTLVEIPLVSFVFKFSEPLLYSIPLILLGIQSISINYLKCAKPSRNSGYNHEQNRISALLKLLVCERCTYKEGSY